MQISGYQKTLTRLHEYLLLPDEPDSRLNPRWLARRLAVPEREMLGALAYAVRDGLVEMRWEVYCPVCGRSPGEFGSLKEAHAPLTPSNATSRKARSVRPLSNASVPIALTRPARRAPASSAARAQA